MLRVSAHEAKQNFGDVLARAQGGPVEIMKYRRRVAVILSTEFFDQLEALKFVEMRRELSNLLACVNNMDGSTADNMIDALPAILRAIEGQYGAERPAPVHDHSDEKTEICGLR